MATGARMRGVDGNTNRVMIDPMERRNMPGGGDRPRRGWAEVDEVLARGYCESRPRHDGRPDGFVCPDGGGCTHQTGGRALARMQG